MIRQFLIVLFLFSLASCSTEEDMASEPAQSNSNLLRYLEDHGQTEYFAEALALADLPLWQTDSNYTLLAPVDSALGLFLQENGVDSIAQLRTLWGASLFNQWVGTHLLPVSFRLDEVWPSYLSTLSQNSKGQALHAYLHREGHHLHCNGRPVPIAQSDISVGNDRVHLIQTVLKPATLRTLIAANYQQLSGLHESLRLTSNLSVALNDPNEEITVFAPNDEGVKAWLNRNQSSGFGQLQSRLGQEAYEEILWAHCTRGILELGLRNDSTVLGSLRDGGYLTLQQNEGFCRVSADNDFSARILIKNIRGLNGNLHLIDQVLKLP